MATDGAELTRDAILRGTLHLWQPRRGYRFNVDSLLLVHFVLTEVDAAPRRALDIGTGCGVVGLALGRARPTWTMEAIEIQPALAALAEKNAIENGVALLVHAADVRHKTLPGASYALVVSNPPYRALRDGPPSSDPALATARHEVELDVASLAAAARRLLVPDGVFAIVFPAPRLADLLSALAATGLTPLVLRAIHPLADRDAELVLVLAQKGERRPLALRPPLVIYSAPSTYSAEVTALLGD